jgi:hypothetical protein
MRDYIARENPWVAQTGHAPELIEKGESRHYVAVLLNVGRSRLYRALILG